MTHLIIREMRHFVYRAASLPTLSCVISGVPVCHWKHYLANPLNTPASL